MTKYVYSFGAGRAEGSSLMRNLLGGKGCELAEMTNLGIPVPPGFTITTHVSPRGSGSRPRRASTSSSTMPDSGSAIPGGRSSSPFAPAHGCRCPA